MMVAEFDDLRAEFKAAFVAAGFWKPARVTSDGSPQVVTDADVAYRRPDSTRLGGSISNDHEIEYVASDFPDLAEGDTVELIDDDGGVIAGSTFRVRQPPYITDNPGDDQSGYFLRALLTQIDDL